MRYITPTYVKVRSFLVEAMPFLLILIVVSIITAMFIVVGTSFDAQREAKEAAKTAVNTGKDAAVTAELARVAALEARNISAGNRLILDKLEPCLPGESLELPRCIRQAQRDRIIKDALASIQQQHNAQSGILQQIEEKPTTVIVPRTTGTTRPRVTSTTSTTRVTSTTRATTRTTTQPIVPTTTTTTCPKKGKSNNCK